MPKKRDINKVKAVAKEYLNNGMDMTNALKSVGEVASSDNVLYNKASRWRNCVEIQEELRALREKFKPEMVDDIYCIINYVDIINAKEAKVSDRVNALNGLAKVIGASKEGQVNNNITFDISQLKTIPVKSIIPSNIQDANIVPNNTSVNLTQHTQDVDTQGDTAKKVDSASDT